jgi:hypothetical protein
MDRVIGNIEILDGDLDPNGHPNPLKRVGEYTG